jgi:hypothetical protein
MSNDPDEALWRTPAPETANPMKAFVRRSESGET